MKYKGLVISDIHVGVIDDKRLYKEIDKVFLYEIENMEKLDFIFILGDYFHSKLFANSTSIDIGMMVMNKITSIAKIKHTKIRIVYGTETHDADQYRLFRIYENDPELDFKVIYTCSDEELFPNVNVLYIPEEYLRDKNTHYEEYFKERDKYDFVLGHGVIKEVMAEATRHIENSKSDKSRLKVPTFTSAELSYICKGKVFFGHYHENTVIDDKVYYVGSYTRWCFGEEKNKGFYEVTMNEDDYKVKFIQNHLAKSYKTFLYGYDSEIYNSEKKLLAELKRIDLLIDYGMFDYVRLVINIPETANNPNLLIDMLREKYKNNKRVKLLITNGIIDKKRKVTDDKVEELIKKYDLIFDKNVNLEDKVVYFIKKRYDKEIDIETVKRHLYSDLDSILQGDSDNEQEQEIDRAYEYRKDSYV